jgi:hypothetical protein
MAELVLLLVSMQAVSVRGQSPKYPPLSEYMMTPDAEVALARSAAPANISDRATIKLLTASGDQVARDGNNNGFACKECFLQLVFQTSFMICTTLNPDISFSIRKAVGFRLYREFRYGLMQFQAPEPPATIVRTSMLLFDSVSARGGQIGTILHLR